MEIMSSPADILMDRTELLKSLEGTQNSQPCQVPVKISQSSDGVERKTGYVGLRTHRVRSRELVFKKNREVKKYVFPVCQKSFRIIR